MEKILIKTNKRIEIIDITYQIAEKISGKIKDGIIICHSPHTTAGILINEHADPQVASDIENHLAKLVPANLNYAHIEGNSDAHIKSVLTGCQLLLIVEDGKIQLGRWQGVFFAEFDGPRTREVWLKIISNKNII